MAKEMLSCRIDSGLRDALAAEAGAESRSVSNMLELVLRERYSVLAGRGSDPVVSRVSGSVLAAGDSHPSPAPSPRPASADRTQMCEHRIGPDAYCGVCDG